MTAPKPANDVKISLDELVGKHLLVGLTFEDEDGGNKKLEQLQGTVSWVDPQKGIFIELAGERAGETYTLPPDTTSVRPARPGEYRLRGSGEIVTNPDFLATWIVVKGPSDQL